MISAVITLVVRTWDLVATIVLLGFAASEPPETHVH